MKQKSGMHATVMLVVDVDDDGDDGNDAGT